MREYRAKFASLFSALERRGPTDNGGPLTVAEALPVTAEEAGAADVTEWGPSAAVHHAGQAVASPARRAASRLEVLLEPSPSPSPSP